MMKKMRRRFIAAAMLAFIAVMALLLVGVNGWNYSVTVHRLDGDLLRLSQFQRDVGERKGQPIPPFPKFGRGPSKEAPYMTRYFSVRLDAQGSLLEANRDYISSISEDMALQYARAVVQKDGQFGFLGEYRYFAEREEDAVSVFFLNAAIERQSVKTLFFVSCLVGAISLTLVFLLVYLFSGRAILPFAENMEKQKQFITDASHELKTPLTSISTSADVLAMDDAENEWVQNIKKQTDRLSKLVFRLVTLSRLDEECLAPKKERLSFSEVVWEALEPFLSVAKADGRSFSYDVEEGLELDGDRALLLQVASILLDNAFRYAALDGQIRLEAYKKRRRAVLMVQNSCELDAKADLDRLFERFYRLDQSRASLTGGAGSGLSIAKAAVEAHGGRIAAESEDGTKICFRAEFFTKY